MAWQEEGEGEEEAEAAPAREALRAEANGAIKKTALRGETEAARAAELERCALPPLGSQGGFRVQSFGSGDTMACR